MYASFLKISGASYLDLFEQPAEREFLRILLIDDCFFLLEGNDFIPTVARSQSKIKFPEI
jgi:hypothetical protein